MQEFLYNLIIILIVLDIINGIDVDFAVSYRTI